MLLSHAMKELYSTRYVHHNATMTPMGGGDRDPVLPRHNGGENYLAEPKLFILTNWRFVIGGSLRIIKFMAIYNWRK